MCGEKNGTAHQHQNLILAVKYSGGSIVVWGCFAVSGSGQLAVIDGKVNSQVYQDQLKLDRSWVMQQDNDPEQVNQQQKKILILEWPSQS